MRGGQALDPIETTSVVVVPKSWHSIEHRVFSILFQNALNTLLVIPKYFRWLLYLTCVCSIFSKGNFVTVPR